MSVFSCGRIVTLPCGAWSSSAAYECLSLVYDADSGNSYIAKKNVPAGTELTNTDYWMLSAEYSAQFASIEASISNIEANIASIEKVLANTDDQIEAKLALTIDDDGVAKLSANANYVELNGGEIIINGNYFSLDEDGKVVAVDGKFSGAITDSTITDVTITGSEITTSGTDGTTTLSDGAITSLGQSMTAVEIPNSDDEDSPITVSCQSYFKLTDGYIELYANEYARASSPLGDMTLMATGLCGYWLSDTPWCRIYNPEQAVAIDGTLDVTGQVAVDGTLDVTESATVNGFSVPETQHGNVVVTPSEAATNTSIEVAFDKAFSGTPTVIVTVQSSVPAARAASILNTTSTGFTLYVYSTGTSNVRVNWLAIY